jgi:hypothetical protein
MMIPPPLPLTSSFTPTFARARMIFGSFLLRTLEEQSILDGIRTLQIDGFTGGMSVLILMLRGNGRN